MAIRTTMNLIEMQKCKQQKQINKKTVFIIFTNTWNAVKICKTTKNKRVGIDFTKPHPLANKGYFSSSKSNYYH